MAWFRSGYNKELLKIERRLPSKKVKKLREKRYRAHESRRRNRKVDVKKYQQGKKKACRT